MSADNRSPQRTIQRRKIYTPGNRFDFDKTKIPPGMAYKWLRVTIGGQEDTENQVMAEMNGWNAVPGDRHPELAGLHAKKDQAIVRGGLMLVEIPKEFEQEAREMETFDAQNTLEENIQRLGLQARQNGSKAQIRRNYEPLDGEIIQ